MAKTVINEAQDDALKKAYSLLGEQFDNVLIVVAFDSTKPDDEDNSEGKLTYFKGGHVAALGMAVWAQHNLLDETPEDIP